MTFLIVFHAIICVMLGIIILMQAGRKGGLTEAFASTESMLGTKTNEFMVTATTIFCVLFFVTSLGLAILSSQKGKSLMTDANVKPKSQQTDALDKMSKDVDAVKQEAASAAVEAKDVVQATVDQAVVAIDPAVTEAAQGAVEPANQAAEAAVQAEVITETSEEQPAVVPAQ